MRKSIYGTFLSALNDMIKSLRQIARRYLPAPLRKPLGSLFGYFEAHVLNLLYGLIFDLKGGCFKADGCRFVIPRDITSVRYRSCFLKGDYEAEERELIRAFVRPQDTVLELGACLGIVSCVTNHILSDKTKHVVIEGNPFCIPAIHRNRELNRAGFLTENCAVSNQSEVTFYLHPVYVVGGTTQRKSSRAVRVPGRSLRELDARYGPFTTLIIDIEGLEQEIFAVSTDVLSRYRLVVVELHEWAIGAAGVDRCREILAAAGLKFRRRAGIIEAWERD